MHVSYLLLCSLALLPAAAVTAPTEAVGAPKPPEAPASKPTVENGPGIVICEPVVREAARDAAELGTGCSKWLQLAVGGQGEFGKTPLWSSLDRARLELGRTDLRIEAADAGKLAATLGVTHVVTAEVRGELSGLTLTYRLQAVPGGTSVGEPIVLKGPAAEVLRGLPGAAQTLCGRLGVEEPVLPKTVPQESADMLFLGRLRWKLGDLPEGSTELKRLQELSKRDALAALLWMRPATWQSPEEILRALRDSVPLAPDNALMLATVGDARREYLPLHTKELAGMLQRFPRNYLLVCSDAWTKRVKKDWVGERQASELLVRCAPQNPESWLTLAKAISDAAERIRKARVIGAMSREELAAVSELYEQWVPATVQAVKADPRCGRAWQRLSVAATFASDPELADQAYWQAVALDSADEPFPVWSWGLEMYHPKWFDNPETLARVARGAATANYDDAAGAFTMAQMLEVYGFHQLGAQLLERAVTQARSEVAEHPSRAAKHAMLGDVLLELGLRPEARKAWEKAVSLDELGIIRQNYSEKLKHYPAAPAPPQ